MKRNIFFVIIIVLFYFQCLAQEVFLPDSTINGVLLLSSPQSACLFYKDISKIRLQDEISSYNPFGYSYIAFVNKDTSQYLIAFAHDGDVINSFSAFEIGYVTSDFLKVVNIYYATDYFLFETESGLRLNMPLDQLLDLKGECYLNKYGNTFFYVIEADKSFFVQKYIHPEYYMRFTVENEAVCTIEFGLTYP